MAAEEDGGKTCRGEGEEYVYRISTATEWEEVQKNGSTFGGQLDRSSGFIHLSNLDQVLFLSLLVVIQLYFLLKLQD